ncbi:MAG: Rho termination factor N-terminal domain-containing protein, partial [Muribaculaceae bacterium]|nr:Rho termination factor N-terminal domain-containing protein [Muribaculaceae bacterium]
MYNISDLENMTDGDIKNVAESLGLKKIDSTDKQELIYRILDEQAIVGAASRAAKRREAPADKAEPKK